jgi:hypothetical protein
MRMVRGAAPIAAVAASRFFKPSRLYKIYNSWGFVSSFSRGLMLTGRLIPSRVRESDNAAPDLSETVQFVRSAAS